MNVQSESSISLFPEVHIKGLRRLNYLRGRYDSSFPYIKFGPPVRVPVELDIDHFKKAQDKMVDMVIKKSDDKFTTVHIITLANTRPSSP